MGVAWGMCLAQRPCVSAVRLLTVIGSARSKVEFTAMDPVGDGALPGVLLEQGRCLCGGPDFFWMDHALPSTPDDSLSLPAGERRSAEHPMVVGAIIMGDPELNRHSFGSAGTLKVVTKPCGGLELSVGRLMPQAVREVSFGVERLERSLVADTLFERRGLIGVAIPGDGWLEDSGHWCPFV